MAPGVSRQFKVRSQSAADTVYCVQVDVTPHFWAGCDCRAGMQGNLCRHVTDVLRGRTYAIAELVEDDLARVVEAVEKTPIANQIELLGQMEDEGQPAKALKAQRLRIRQMIRDSSLGVEVRADCVVHEPTVARTANKARARKRRAHTFMDSENERAKIISR